MIAGRDNGIIHKRLRGLKVPGAHATLRPSAAVARMTTEHTVAESESSEEAFKVTDRRGRAKEEPAPPPASELHQPTAPVETGPPLSAEPRRPDLQGVFVMFATSALISLGEAADPATRERRVDLDQAREAIDVLLLLRDKTSGNRTEQENLLLEQLIYDLQMRFVRASDARPSR